MPLWRRREFKRHARVAGAIGKAWGERDARFLLFRPGTVMAIRCFAWSNTTGHFGHGVGATPEQALRMAILDKRLKERRTIERLDM